MRRKIDRWLWRRGLYLNLSDCIMIIGVTVIGTLMGWGFGVLVIEALRCCC